MPGTGKGEKGNCFLFFVLDFILFLNREIVDNGHRVDVLPDEKRSGLWLYKCDLTLWNCKLENGSSGKFYVLRTLS